MPKNLYSRLAVRSQTHYRWMLVLLQVSNMVPLDAYHYDPHHYCWPVPSLLHFHLPACSLRVFKYEQKIAVQVEASCVYLISSDSDNIGSLRVDNTDSCDNILSPNIILYTYLRVRSSSKAKDNSKKVNNRIASRVAVVAGRSSSRFIMICKMNIVNQY
jgi:hypothetical protein